MKFDTKTYIFGTHSKNGVLIYYHKKYHIKMYEYDSFTITSKKANTNQENIKKKVLNAQENEQQAQRYESTTALDNEHRLAQKLQQRFNTRYGLINEL
jgi:hypothetical protein